jgi:hypothetical protein
VTEIETSSPAPTPPPDQRHEPGDENYRLILLTALILAASIAVSFVVCGYLMEYMRKRETREKAGQFPLAVEENRMSISERLQQMPQGQPLLEGFKRQEGYSIDVRPQEKLPTQQGELNRYGPAEPPEKGYASIPINVAMRLMLAKNRFPVQERPKSKGIGDND